MTAPRIEIMDSPLSPKSAGDAQNLHFAQKRLSKAPKARGPAFKKAGGCSNRTIRFLLYWCASLLGIWSGIAVASIIGFYALRMPSADNWIVPDRPPNVKILASNGDLVANRGITGGEAVNLAFNVTLSASRSSSN